MEVILHKRHIQTLDVKEGKDRPIGAYSTSIGVPELDPVVGSQSVDDRSHKPGGLGCRNLSSRGASQPVGRYQIILLGDRDAPV